MYFSCQELSDSVRVISWEDHDPAPGPVAASVSRATAHLGEHKSYQIWTGGEQVCRRDRNVTRAAWARRLPRLPSGVPQPPGANREQPEPASPAHLSRGAE